MSKTVRMVLVGIVSLSVFGCAHDHASHAERDRQAAGVDALPHHAEMTGPDVVVLRGDQQMEIAGRSLRVGDEAPEALLIDTRLSDVTLSSLRGKVVLISIAPSLDTSVCSSQTIKLDNLSEEFGEAATFLSVSRDLPFALDRWAQEHEVERMRLLSDARGREFGEAFGVLMRKNGLLARGLIVVGRDGRIRHVQLVHRITDEPDYAPAMQAVRDALRE
jgi:thioredoxin-dependent peroxiredoxin